MATDITLSDRLEELSTRVDGVAGLHVSLANQLTQLDQELKPEIRLLLGRVDSLANRMDDLAAVVSELQTTLARLTSTVQVPVSVAPVPPTNPPGYKPRMILPDRFEGDPDRFRTFRESCRLYFKFTPFTTEEERVALVISLLKGAPQDWALALPSSAPEWSSVDTFFASLGQLYDDPHRASLAIRKLISLRQGKRTAEEYCTEFRQWCAMSGWDDSPLIAQFQRGLSDIVRDSLVSHPVPDKLSDFMALVIGVDRRLRERRREKMCNQTRPDSSVCTPLVLTPDSVRPSNPAPAHQSGTWGEPMELGIVQSPLDRRQYRRHYGLCFYCGESGHFISACRKRPQRSKHQCSGDTQERHLGTQVRPGIMNSSVTPVMSQNYMDDSVVLGTCVMGTEVTPTTFTTEAAGESKQLFPPNNCVVEEENSDEASGCDSEGSLSEGWETDSVMSSDCETAAFRGPFPPSSVLFSEGPEAPHKGGGTVMNLSAKTPALTSGRRLRPLRRNLRLQL